MRFRNHTRAAIVATVVVLGGGGVAVQQACTCSLPGAQPSAPTDPAPVLSSAIVGTSGTLLTLTYNEALDGASEPLGNAYTVNVAASNQPSPTVDVTGSTVLLSLSQTVYTGQAVLLSYSAGASPVQDLSGSDAANFSNQVVTNNSTVSAPAGGTFNIWVDTTTAGATCTDSAVPQAYVDNLSCTWDQANDTAEEGDTIGVKAGSYGEVNITGTGGGRNSAPNAEFHTATGEVVTISHFFNGFATNDTGGDYLSFVGPVTTGSVNNDQTVSVGFDGWTVDNGFQCAVGSCLTEDSQIMHMEGVNGATFQNGEIGNACSITGKGGMVFLTGTNITISHNEIHDAHMCDAGGDPHTECVFATGTNNVTMSRNVFHHCGVQTVFVTGWDGDTFVSGWVVENNVIGRPCGDNVGPHVCSTPGGNAFHFRSGAGTSGDPAPIPSGWVIRYNTFKGNLSINNGSPPLANIIKGNIFLSSVACGIGNTTYSYNAHLSGSCGGTGSFNDAGLATDFVNGNDYAVDGGDWTPISGGAQVNVGDLGNYPTLDLLGATRYDGAKPDIGAVELQE